MVSRHSQVAGRGVEWPTCFRIRLPLRMRRIAVRCSIVLDRPFFFCFVRCGVQDGGVQDCGDLNRMMHDARTSLPIRPAARRQYPKCSPF